MASVAVEKAISKWIAVIVCDSRRRVLLLSPMMTDCAKQIKWQREIKSKWGTTKKQDKQTDKEQEEAEEVRDNREDIFCKKEGTPNADRQSDSTQLMLFSGCCHWYEYDSQTNSNWPYFYCYFWFLRETS